MRIFYPPEGTGCWVTVSEGFLDAFCEDHPGSSLRGLTSLTVHFDEAFKPLTLRLKGDEKAQRRPEDLRILVLLARAFALERQGERPVRKVLPKAPPRVEASPLVETKTLPSSPLPDGFESLRGRRVIRRRADATL